MLFSDIRFGRGYTVRKIARGYTTLSSRKRARPGIALLDNERGRRPPRIRRKRLLIFTIMQRARSGSIREKSPRKKELALLGQADGTRLSHDIYFTERLSCAKPLENPCRRYGGHFAGTCPCSRISFFLEPHCPRTCICTRYR